MKVLKFGGSSVGTPERIRVVKKIIESTSFPAVVVISAFHGVTDQLNQVSLFASQRKEEYKEMLNKLIYKHKEYTLNLISDPLKRESVLKTIETLFDELIETLNGIYLLRELSRHASDQVLGFGERLSSLIIS